MLEPEEIKKARAKVQRQDRAAWEQVAAVGRAARLAESDEAGSRPTNKRQDQPQYGAE
jgi:hypothetical protein